MQSLPLTTALAGARLLRSCYDACRPDDGYEVVACIRPCGWRELRENQCNRNNCKWLFQAIDCGHVVFPVPWNTLRPTSSAGMRQYEGPTDQAVLGRTASDKRTEDVQNHRAVIDEWKRGMQRWREHAGMPPAALVTHLHPITFNTRPQKPDRH